MFDDAFDKQSNLKACFVEQVLKKTLNFGELNLLIADAIVFSDPDSPDVTGMAKAKNNSKAIA